MSFMCKIEVGPKREECKKGGWCTGCQKFFEVGPRREKCEKGGGCEKGGCEAVPHLGAKKNFRALRARTHLKKILNTPLLTYLKELYTSETTLAQKIVLTPLNNEFRLKI